LKKTNFWRGWEY